VLGAWPSKELLQRLTSSGGNALHAVSVLHELRRTGAISIDGDRATVVREAAAAASTLRDMISAQLALLDGSSRGLLQKLAVWGSATTLEQLASIDQSNPVALLEPVQTAVGSGTATLSETGYLAFTHDLYAEVLYDELAPALRRLLHTAIAQVSTQRSDTQIVAHHLVAAGAPQALDAVYNAESELTSVPAVAVDLLDSAAHMGE
jgi:predicted ATPase